MGDLQRWQNRGEKPLYHDRWVKVNVADVELPDGSRIEHRVVRTARSAGAVVLNSQHQVLLIWRHRFITDSWGYEIPSGKIDPGETPMMAAAREVEEETGWRPGKLQPLVYSQPSSGFMDSEDHAFLATDAAHIGPPTDTNEAQRIEWIPTANLPELIRRREIVGGPTLVALLQLLAIPPADLPLSDRKDSE